MITRFKKYLIKENPDHIYYNGERLNDNSKEAHPFAMIVNSNHTSVQELFIGRPGTNHSGDTDYNYRKQTSYPGRIWTKSKVISFWVYPNEILFRDFINKLEEKLNIKIFNNGWKIEVIKFDDHIVKRDYDEDANDYYYWDVHHGDNTEIIPIEEYAGSEDVPEEIQIQHLMKWNEKELAKKMGKIHFKGFGSDKTAWDSKHNIKYRQAIYQENKVNK